MLRGKVHISNLFNVAITRARGLLQVVGDREAALASGVDYLADFAAYVAGLQATPPHDARQDAASTLGPDYPPVARPEQVSDWERLLYRALHAAGVRAIPQYTVEQYDLDFAFIVGERRLNIEVDGERYHRSWTGELCLRDQLRNQRLIELGWEVRRFWVYEVRDQLEECVGVVRGWVEGRGDLSGLAMPGIHCPHIPPGGAHDCHYRIHQKWFASGQATCRCAAAGRGQTCSGARAGIGSHHLPGGPHVGSLLSGGSAGL